MWGKMSGNCKNSTIRRNKKAVYERKISRFNFLRKFWRFEHFIQREGVVTP